MSKTSIAIYSDEMKAGIAKAVASQNVLAYLCPLIHSATANVKVTDAARAALDSDVTFDLYPIHTILVTTGWNNNDDIFTRKETFAARLTPEDKPFNVGHEPRQIIGHMTSSSIVDDNLVVIADDTPFEDIPDKFHILTGAVIYRHISSRDETLEAEAAEMIQSIEDGNHFVSMECLFNNFDYGVTYSSGEQQIVDRTQSTSFLTKHLRAYGGDGEYNGGKLGRVLRNITFSGKGLVENPANPESVILNDTKKFVGIVATDIPTIPKNNTLGETNMADEKYEGQLEDQIKVLQADLATSNKKNEELSEARTKSAISEKDTAIAGLETELKAAKAKVEELTASYNDATKAKEAAEAGKAEVDDKLTEATTKLSEVEVTAKATARVALMVDKGIDKAEAEVAVAEFGDLDDDKFAKIVDMKSDIAKAAKPDDKEDEKKKKKAAKAGEDTDDKGAAAAEDADLEGAKADADPDMGSAGEENKKDETMKAMAAYFDNSMHSDNK